MAKQVIYKGMSCWLLELEESFPANEIMKEISAEEYACLTRFGKFPLN
ncbi:hypothetical protein [Streptococcus sanguinis]|nr:hypothetical protein [Streptococcus sanguinis]